ncbi:conserved hypothetical protein [Segniliparus rotundus DSM 44985]|uniref:3'-5' exoribonuclease n=1 Tax=Segniliparus rotundus (strain ATCC BAA-972 / CDC 1076 / CIP 108378 / DSM 44985 / JCM 13578) TaxID=640132 RepID=D6ZF18_SEGRD|nr:polyadenylate-specific 3'-exoribonuclease AS [Segniliparus rotundus]ADG97542.1 conserved hypothetical protein [Segniliparus rotundus DSM 44985]
MPRFFYDTEFIEDGVTIDLVSIGVVAEDGREFYRVSTGFDASKAGKWVRENVLAQLPPLSSPLWVSRAKLREELLEFLTAEGEGPIELWAWMGAYDHVVLCQLWGAMPALPRALPRYTRDVRQLWEERGSPPLPPVPEGAHDALVDARHCRARYETLQGS